MGKISELEGVVLGLIGRGEPCTAYAVRRAIQSSPSTHWSASAGALYPLITRLGERGLVRSEADPSDGRGRTLLSLTDGGRTALRAWILQASDPRVSASVSDAVRARAFFLESLTPADRRRFAEESLASLEAFLGEAVEYEDRVGADNPFVRLAARGAVRSAKARVDWMRELLEATLAGSGG